jgi:allantoinase
MTTLRSNRVVVGGQVRPATIRYEDGVVVAIGHGSADRDYGDLVVLPGLVDSHVHVNEPGRTEWEGFETATSAAAAGGTTTIVDMPLNSVPPTTTVEALREKRQAAYGKLSVDCAFWGGIVPGSEPDVDELEAAGVCGFKVFLVDSGVPEFPPVDIAVLQTLEIETPLLVHAELESHLKGAGADYQSYLESRPPLAEADAIRAVDGLGPPVHILHVSSADGVAAIADAAPGMTGETCPHYLIFSADDVTGTEFKCAPPIREREHREALWEGLANGHLGLIVSDHSPSPPALKKGDFSSAWGGISSLQMRLGAVWSGAVERSLGIEQVVGWLATGPARLAGIDDRKGSIDVRKDADFVIFDPDGITKVRGSNLYNRHPLTPYEGMGLRGRVVETMLRGGVVYDGSSVTGASGRMLRRR